MSEILCGIYKIQNNINGKCYIGQSQNIKRRWKDHKKEYKWKNSQYSHYPLYKAINKYGIDNFSFDIIEICNPDELNQKEIYWIQHYNSITNGYNVNPGGFLSSDKNKKLNQVQVLEIINELKNTTLTQEEIAKKYNTTQENISQINTGKYYVQNNIKYPIRRNICGIYMIKNKLNNKCYIGQSKNIFRRWKEHLRKKTNSKRISHIDKALIKYGKENFEFTIIEECIPEKLNEKEEYWIKYYNSINNGYNMTSGGNQPDKACYKLNEKKILEIESLLKNTFISMEKIGEKYGVTKGLIANINCGNIHTNITKSDNYPIRKHNINKKENHCKNCNKLIPKKRVYCDECFNQIKHQRNKEITKDELNKLIQTTPFTQIGEFYGISDNAVRKWCKKYGLPYKKTDIKKRTT